MTKRAQFVRQSTSFILVGEVGMSVDAGLLTWLSQALDWNLIRSRVICLCAAVSVAWLLNRRSTFRDQASGKKRREWVRYAVGARLTLGMLLLLINHSPFLRLYPVIPLAITALLALVFNFLASWAIASRGEAPLPISLQRG